MLQTLKAKTAALALAVAAVLALGGAAMAPQPAYAKSYTCPQVTMTAQAQTDAGLRVVERRTFDFDGTFSAVWWTLGGNLPGNAEVRINALRMARIDSAGTVVGNWTSLPSVAFQLPWREAGGPSRDAYSFDSARDTVYAFFDVTDGSVVFEVDYEVANAVQPYDDVAELYWKYVGDQWAGASEDVSLTVALPVPEGTAVTPGENVRAWGHGPLDGVVEVKPDGTVAYQVPLVKAGQYAEARVLFPRQWLTALSPEAAAANQGVTRLDTVLSEEESWADAANTQRTMALLYIVAIIVACVAALAVALLLFRKYGREHTPDFTGEYWRDVPEPGMEPALIGRLWRWNHESNDDFTATVMAMAQKGLLRLDKGSYPDARGKMVDDYYITRVEPAVATPVSPIERAALDLLFGTIGQGATSLWLGSIGSFGKDNPQAYIDGMNKWQGLLSAEANAKGFFEVKSKKMATVVGAMATLYIVVGIALSVMMGDFIPALAMVPTGIALAVIANYMPRRTLRGNNIAARCKALRNWLRDFSRLDERPPTDVKVWGQFMVYAYLFGVAKRTIKELQDAVPELFEQAVSAPGYGYMPWYVWYMPMHGASGTLMPSVSDMFQASVANTFSTAQQALAAAKGGSGFSGGFGGGGGFSVGGGGGFGGGGGAR